jgi:hypothetical protein
VIAALVALAFVVWWRSRADVWDNERRRVERKFVYCAAAIGWAIWAFRLPSPLPTVGLVGMGLLAAALAIPGEWVRVERQVYAARRALAWAGQRLC